MNYRFEVFWSGEDREYVAREISQPRYRRLSALDSDPVEALAQLRVVMEHVDRHYADMERGENQGITPTHLMTQTVYEPPGATTPHTEEG